MSLIRLLFRWRRGELPPPRQLAAQALQSLRKAALALTILAAAALTVHGLRGPIAAHAYEGSFTLGTRLLAYQGAITQELPRTVSFNGAEILLSTGTTDDAVETLLSSFAARCDGAGSDERLAPLFDGEPPPGRSLIAQDGDRGFATCVLTGVDLSSPSESLAAIQQFLRDGDVGALGGFRYVYAERRGDRTHFAGLYAADMDVDQMFPIAGDVPGADATALPRPQGSNRVLSVFEKGTSYGMTLYTGANGSLAAQRQGYEKLLVAHGWQVSWNASEKLNSTETSLLVTRNGAMAFVVLFEHQGRIATAIVADDAGHFERMIARARELAP